MLHQYRRRLQAQLGSPEVGRDIERVLATYPIFKKYPTLGDLVDLVKAGNRNYADKDAVLRILLVEVGKTPSTLFPLLNWVFWDSLAAIYNSKRRDVRDKEELFSQVQTGFFHAVVAYPLNRRPRKVDVNLVLDTKKKVTAWQREEIAERRLHRAIPESHAGMRRLSEFQESTVFPEELEAYLLDLVYRKVIDERQYNLLLETQVYRRMSQKEWAQTHGVAYATARSWHRRAKQAIWKYEKERREHHTGG